MIEELQREPELAVTRSGLQKLGFTGFEQIGQLQKRGASGQNVGCSVIPRCHGVYAVVCPTDLEPQFLERPDPDTQVHGYSISKLRGQWVEGAEILNFGKAESKQNGLRGRIRQYVRFGLGEVRNHAGGRSIWQLESVRNLAIGYYITEGHAFSARDLECFLTLSFKKVTGRPPFAWREGS